MRPSQRKIVITRISASLVLIVAITLVARATTLDKHSYLPLVAMPEPIDTPLPAGQEFRGIWVTRWDWAPGATQSTIDNIVNDIHRAGFNAILFQVRGAADAYYPSSIEPWGRLLTGALGGDPGFDPLQRMIQKAHEKGIQVHAYINVYPVWDKCTIEGEKVPPEINPRPLYYLLKDKHGQPPPSGVNNGLQWDTGDKTICADGYLWASPASLEADTHFIAVARDLANRYDIDGLHLDRIRYAQPASSCDPVSEGVAGVNCFNKPTGYLSYASFQRVQVNGTVAKFYDLVANEHPDLLLSAAVWHVYQDKWGWGYSEGYHDLYQDSQGWMQDSIIDAIMPMIYSSRDGNSDPNAQTFPQWKWQLLVADYVANDNGRFVIAGIGSNHYASFNEIEARINIARQLGAAGHSIFSYSGLKSSDSGVPGKDYFDLLRAGPYAAPASIPPVNWH